MTTLEAPPARLHRPAFWMALFALLLLLGGLYIIALPDVASGPVVLTFDTGHGLHQSDVMGLSLLALGVGMTWIAGLIWQRQYTH